MKAITLNILCLLLMLSSYKGLHAQKKALSLTDALEMAAQGNKALQVQTLEEIRYKELTRDAKSRLLPNISAGGAYSYYFDRQVIFLPGSFAGTTKPVQDVAVGGKNAFNSFLSFSQPVLMPTARRQTEAAVVTEKMQKEKTSDLQSKLALQTSVAYFNMLLMKSQVQLQEQSLQRNIKALEDERSLFAQGRSLKVDTLRSYIAVETLKSSISYLRNSIDVAGIQLKRLIGLNAEVELDLTDSLSMETVQIEISSLNEAVKAAELNRQDIKMQKLTIDLEQKQLAAVMAERSPQLSIVGQYQLQTQADDIRFGNYTWPRTSYLGLQLTLPIFNGYYSSSQINQANIRVQQEKIRLNDLKDEIHSELASIISRWKEAVAQLDIQKRTIEAAGINYTMVDERYKNGLSSRLELTDAELALTQAKLSYLQAIHNLKVLHVTLKESLGLLKL